MNERQRFSVSGELRMLVITALWEYIDRRRPHPEFTVDEWDARGGKHRRVIAGAFDMAVARAAFDAAAAKWPDAILTLRNGARVVQEWPKLE